MSCIQNNQQNVIFHVLELFFIIQPEPRRKQMGRDDRLLIIKINHVTRPGNTWMQIGIDPEGIFKNLREYAFYLIITPMRSTQNWKDLAEYKSEYDASYSKDIQGATGNTSSKLSFHRWYCTFSCNLLTSVCQIFARGRIRSFVCLSKPILKAWKIRSSRRRCCFRSSVRSKKFSILASGCSRSMHGTKGPCFVLIISGYSRVSYRGCDF